MRILLITATYPSGDRIGGAEYQTYLLAHGLAKKGHTCVFLAADAGREGRYLDHEVEVIELPGWEQAGISAHRTALASIVNQVAPDVCYVRTFIEIAHVVDICRNNNIPMVTISCAGPETAPFLLGNHPRATLSNLRSQRFRLHFAAFRSLKASAAHLCNTKTLTAGLKRWQPPLPVRTIYNGTPMPPDDEIHDTASGQIIWVNNLKPVKRPEWFIRLAAHLPAYRFVMIGGLYGGRYGAKLEQLLAQAPSNFAYLGRLPIAEVNRHIGASDLLLYTTEPGYEGFGNSFLQAWIRGVPTVSTFDFDAIIADNKVGLTATTFDALLDKVTMLMQDDDMRTTLGQTARDVALTQFSTQVMVDKYDDLFHTCAGTRRVESSALSPLHSKVSHVR